MRPVLVGKMVDVVKQGHLGRARNRRHSPTASPSRAELSLSDSSRATASAESTTISNATGGDAVSEFVEGKPCVHRCAGASRSHSCDHSNFICHGHRAMPQSRSFHPLQDSLILGKIFYDPSSRSVFFSRMPTSVAIRPQSNNATLSNTLCVSTHILRRGHTMQRERGQVVRIDKLAGSRVLSSDCDHHSFPATRRDRTKTDTAFGRREPI